MRAMMRTVPLAVLLVALFILGSAVSIPRGHPLIVTKWTGLAGDGKWETAGNWDNGVPTLGFVANIPLPGGFVVTISTAQSTNILDVAPGDTVTCESTCTLTLQSLANSGTFINFGTVIPDGLSNTATGIFTNFGTITLSVAFMNDGTFTNRCHGTINMTPTAGTGTFTTDPTCPPSGPVGGFMMPVNKLAVFAPYLALFGVMAVVVVAVAPWKKREN